MENEEYYIEDNDLVELLKEVLGDKITDEDIEKILKASEDGDLSEDDFDNLVDEILSRSKDNAESFNCNFSKASLKSSNLLASIGYNPE